MKDFIRVMKALADPNRTRILKLLQKKCLCVCEITDVIKLKQPSVSKHLKILENAGLVYFQKKGRRTCYKIANGEDNPYAAAIMGNLKHWLNEIEGIRQA
jgi:ArsR family transcriptional regulator